MTIEKCDATTPSAWHTAGGAAQRYNGLSDSRHFLYNVYLAEESELQLALANCSSHFLSLEA
jgi:hypothetical protein